MSDTVLIIGGGVTGLLAALTVVNQGAKAIVVEQRPLVGGKRAARLIDRNTQWKDVESVSGLTDVPQLKQAADHPDIEILTLSELQSLQGSAGDFTATIKEQARFVTEDCTRCAHCVAVCPEVVPNEFDAGLSFRKAIHGLLPEGIPNYYAIDIQTCLNVPPNYLPCQRCVTACDDNAIHFDMPLEQIREEHVAAVIVAVGFDDVNEESVSQLEEFGYGKFVDIVSMVEMQRLLESPGPSGGFAAKPSNEEYPESVLIVVPKASAFSNYVLTQQIATFIDQDIKEISLLILDQPVESKNYQSLLDAAEASKLTLMWGAWLDVTDNAPDAENVNLQQNSDHQQNVLQVKYINLATNNTDDIVVDLVVLASDIAPVANLSELAGGLSLPLTDSGFLAVAEGNETERAGVFAAGGAIEAWSVADSFEQARTAVRTSLRYVSRHGKLREKEAQETATDETESQSLLKTSQPEQKQQLENLLHSLMKLGGS